MNSSISSPSVKILVGIPGSGKSTYASELIRQGYVCINQDTLGSRSACIEAFIKALKAGKPIVIDRTNVNKSQRGLWVDIAKTYNAQNIVCVLFDVPTETCIERVIKRENHPTIKSEMSESAKIAIIKGFLQTWEDPCISEGFDAMVKNS